MKIESYKIYKVSIPTRRRHTWASSTADVGQGWVILEVKTDDGIVGYGEATTMPEWGGDFGRYYGESYETTEVVIRDNLFPAIVGMDPFDIDLIHHKMDKAIRGFVYAKAAICSRRRSSSISSLRRRRRVSGVRRSCETAASARERSSMSRRRRCCMRLKACAAWRASCGPFSARGGALRSLPSASAAPANCCKGRVAWRTANMTTPAMMSNETMRCVKKSVGSAGVSVPREVAMRIH